MLASLADARLNISQIRAFANAEPIPLRWGEIIPLSFLNDHAVIVLSIPSKRSAPVPMIPELIQLGRHLRDYFEKIPRRVVVVISADLAHTHLECGPFGYSDTAAPFDEACGQWAKTLDPKPLLVDAASLVDRALSCGFPGLVLLEGILEPTREQWKPELLANFHPTYYGMLVAKFEKINN